ncbi:hypothetical protein Clacol_001399 [Clathrus columnatus]|uniref:Btz domain-containing protein n=1 Tax=Clathrus columnatus TaxID=1419009 RepID=A0AAV4ZY68_9AGAM|nr:hypothetical protein Clacol_001399 [Clathrus columnatus]
MPAPARISVVVKPRQTKEEDVNLKSISHRQKGRVVPRRRGRGRIDETDSEEELVREPRSDSESETATSTIESESASEFDSETEEEPKSMSHESASPSTTPPRATTTAADAPVDSTFFPKQESWSDMVANQNIDELPVVEFSDLHLQESAVVTQQRSAVPSPPPSEHEHGPKLEPGTQSSSRGGKASSFSRKPGQSAREAYINRLNNDPAYVPTVGQFWSHDDRLLDKDLRSLSNWWRGKWQGRGRGIRGRGNFGNGWGVRGRGGAFRTIGHRSEGPDVSQSEPAWSHDKFEEVRVTDPFRERNSFTRGGRAFKAQARNFSRKDNDRNQSTDEVSQPPVESLQSAAPDILQLGDGQRTWFAMKPERVWTKQFDGYLHFDSQLKPLQTQGLGQGVRVKLPKSNLSSDENEPVIIRLPLDTSQNKQTQAAPSDMDAPSSFAVKLPSLKSLGKQKEVVVEDVTTISPLHVDEQLPSTSAVPLYQESSSSLAIPKVSQPSISIAETMLSSDNSSVQNEEMSTSGALVNGDIPTLEEPTTSVPLQAHTQPPQPPTSAPMQVLSPPFQPSSSYTSPFIYSAHGMSLPPGIAVAENGITYEIATGRAVYLQTPPPPPPHILQAPVYNPRPMSIHHGHHNSMPYISGSMPLSVSPPGFLPTPPLFALPRQSSRIEIRAPGEPKDKNRESQRLRSAGQEQVSNPKGVETFTPNGQATGSYFPEGQPLYTPSTYYYPYAPDGSASFGYGQYSGIDSNQTYEQYNQDPYSHHSGVYPVLSLYYMDYL